MNVIYCIKESVSIGKTVDSYHTILGATLEDICTCPKVVGSTVKGHDLIVQISGLKFKLIRNIDELNLEESELYRFINYAIEAFNECVSELGSKTIDIDNLLKRMTLTK